MRTTKIRLAKCRSAYRVVRTPAFPLSIWTTIILALFLLAVSGAAAAGEGSALQDIVDTQTGIRSLETRFEQAKTLSLFDETIVTTGTIVVEKPDFYCWIYDEPDRTVFYVDGLRSGSFDPVSGVREEVELDSRKGLASILRSVTSIITGNLDPSTQSDYEISQIHSEDGNLLYTFHPRSAEIQDLFEQVTIRFDQDTGLARELEFVEPNGDYSHMKFDDWQINTEVDRAALLE